jgi:hypothetical protein
VHVHHDDIDILLVGDAHRLGAVVCARDDFDARIRGERLGDDLAHVTLVIDDEHAHRLGCVGVVLHGGVCSPTRGVETDRPAKFVLDTIADPSYGEGAMYANAPHASAATPPLSPLPLQQQPTQASLQHGLPQGMPPAAPGGSHGMQQGSAIQPTGFGAPVQVQRPGAAFVTGAYQASGDPAIDRMLRLEAACKRFGTLR